MANPLLNRNKKLGNAEPNNDINKEDFVANEKENSTSKSMLNSLKPVSKKTGLSVTVSQEAYNILVDYAAKNKIPKSHVVEALILDCLK